MARDPNLNALWCRVIVEELARAGVHWAVLCPGSRNSPLLFALGRQPGLACLSHVDERSAGFIALGLAKASRTPVAICITSGSAVANLLPAVVEAHAAGIPLIILAADRPFEVQDVGAPQTMRQRGIFGDFAGQEIDCPEPHAEDLLVRSLRARISRAVQAAQGPVLINVPLREPLPPLPDPRFTDQGLGAEALEGRGLQTPYTRHVGVGAAAAGQGVALLDSLDGLRPGLRGVIVVGAEAVSDEAAVIELVAATGYPLIADAASGLRRAGVPVITAADALLGGALGETHPELIIQIGALPLARPVFEWLGRQTCPWLAIAGSANRDSLSRAWAAISCPEPGFYAALGARLHPGAAMWRERWHGAQERAVTAQRRYLAQAPWSEVLAAHLVCSARDQRPFLHLASSMAVRHGNLHCQANRVSQVFANRGVNGIDGTLGSFIGENLALGGGGVLLIGDLAFLHDLPALAAALDASSPQRERSRQRGAIVVLNNGGGGIFDFLSVSQVPGWQTYVRTPQPYDLSGIAQAFGCPFVRVTDGPSLSAALERAAGEDALWLIEAMVGDGCVEAHRGLLRAMAEAGSA